MIWCLQPIQKANQLLHDAFCTSYFSWIWFSWSFTFKLLHFNLSRWSKTRCIVNMPLTTQHSNDHTLSTNSMFVPNNSLNIGNSLRAYWEYYPNYNCTLTTHQLYSVRFIVKWHVYQTGCVSTNQHKENNSVDIRSFKLKHGGMRTWHRELVAANENSSSWQTARMALWCDSRALCSSWGSLAGHGEVHARSSSPHSQSCHGAMRCFRKHFLRSEKCVVQFFHRIWCFAEDSRGWRSPRFTGRVQLKELAS